eukprot:CAMPEP_0171862874 /NCGR_PEP_ID=MMETSP0992-20121227/27933_1 /TAXON_ID=483369 /ORGANISM="non described non described, Strain CCMP2098" /LENGTH=43 /DNA_ID= /DNA_START= /DNA_END= /DNA_ORIENTATION=
MAMLLSSQTHALVIAAFKEAMLAWDVDTTLSVCEMPDMSNTDA